MLRSIPLYGYITVYPFTCWRTLGLFPAWGQLWVELLKHSCTGFWGSMSFHFSKINTQEWGGWIIWLSVCLNLIASIFFKSGNTIFFWRWWGIHMEHCFCPVTWPCSQTTPFFFKWWFSHIFLSEIQFFVLFFHFEFWFSAYNQRTLKKFILSSDSTSR